MSPGGNAVTSVTSSGSVSRSTATLKARQTAVVADLLLKQDISKLCLVSGKKRKNTCSNRLLPIALNFQVSVLRP